MKLGEIQRYHYQCEYSTHEGDYGSSIDPDGDGEWVKFTDAQAKSLADERRIAELEALLAELRNPLKAIRDAITNEALRKAQDDFMPIYGRVFYRIPEAALRVGDAK